MLTRLTFVTFEGTEYELHDQPSNPSTTGGQPLYVPCPFTYPSGASRGRVFVSADGTAVTFISDTTIYDSTYPGYSNQYYPSGYLMLRDGTRYRIGREDADRSWDGLVVWMRDRNGNRLTFAYDSSRQLTGITDSLNRQVSITYGTGTLPFYDTISYKGFGGATRTIQVWYNNLGSVLRSTQPSDITTTQTYGQLFPGTTRETATVYNKQKISAVVLANNQQYNFKYNPYGELARVELPTGGAYEYDYASGVPGDVGGVFNLMIYRRVAQRRVYSDGHTLEGKRIFNIPAFAGQSTTTAIIDKVDASVTPVVLAREKHYYYGTPIDAVSQGPTTYPAWKEGKEYQTEALQVTVVGGTPVETVLRRVTNTWQQRAAVTWWGGTIDSLTAPPNDPRLIQTVTTLVDTNQVSQQTFSYDQYNNRTGIWEYDYGSPAYATRYTQTNYLTANLVGGTTYYYDTVNSDASGPNVNLTYHLRNLPTEQLVYLINPSTGTGTVVSDMLSFYDRTALIPRTSISGMVPGFNNVPRGNVTQISKWLNPGNTWLNTDQQYDIAGNTTQITYPRRDPVTGNPTTVINFSFDDNFGAPNGDMPPNMPPTELTSPPCSPTPCSAPPQTSYAFATQVTRRVSDALQLMTYAQFDYYTGKSVNLKDENQVVTSNWYADALDRPTQFVLGSQTGYPDPSQTTFSYDDLNNMITTHRDLTTFTDGLLVSQLLYDGLGRTIETRQYENTNTYTTTVQGYDAMGRVSFVDNPLRCIMTSTPPCAAGDSTYGWTQTTYDALSRVIAIDTYDSVGTPTGTVQTQYSGSMVLVTDQAAKQRLSQRNALGQLTTVWEITPNDPVTYPG